MVGSKRSWGRANAKGRVARGTSSTLAYLRRLRTYLWIGLVNPGPPSYDPRR
jgi:hypothetical protein